MEVRYSDNPMGQRKIHKWVERFKGGRTGVTMRILGNHRLEHIFRLRSRLISVFRTT